ncbi:hypothetical protein OESDEN_25654, partial [Oesophagostomum dentatum]
MAPRNHVDVITSEVLKRRDILWDKCGTRTPNLNRKRAQAWQDVRHALFATCDKDMSVEQIKRCWRAKKSQIRELIYKEKRYCFITMCYGFPKTMLSSYRQGTGGGVDEQLEAAIKKSLDLMSDEDIAVARLLGKEASFMGLRTAETTVVAAAPPSLASSPFEAQTREDPCCSGNGRASTADWVNNNPIDQTLSKELDGFDSLSDPDEDDQDPP